MGLFGEELLAEGGQVGLVEGGLGDEGTVLGAHVSNGLWGWGWGGVGWGEWVSRRYVGECDIDSIMYEREQ